MTIYRAEHRVTRPNFLGEGEWNLSALTDITVLMGKNGSGKSVLLRAWRDQSPNQVHYIVPERTGDMNYQAHYMDQESSGDKRSQHYRGNFAEEYRRRILVRVQTYFMTRGNYTGAAPTPNSPREVESLIGALIPDFAVQLVVATPPYSLTRIATQEKITGIEQLSSGEAQLLTLGLDIVTMAAMWELEERSERVMLIDEPDAHIHPDLQARFADFLCRVGERFSLQVVVSTHSTSLLSAIGQFGGSKASAVYVNRLQLDYAARPFDAVSKELASCLGGHVLMGPLFGAPILLVEGDDDYRVWSQVPRHHVLNVAVIPCNGEEIKKYQATLERILASLCESSATPIGFALLDGDKRLPMPSAENPQKFIRFIGLKCHEVENLYLTEAVLTELGHTWTSACEALVREAPRFGNKADMLRSCADWNRKDADIKRVINEVAIILDAKSVAWTQRVGSAIGRKRPIGELENFLGQDLVATLWPTKGGAE